MKGKVRVVRGRDDSALCSFTPNINSDSYLILSVPGVMNRAPALKQLALLGSYMCSYLLWPEYIDSGATHDLLELQSPPL